MDDPFLALASLLAITGTLFFSGRAFWIMWRDRDTDDDQGWP